MATFSNRKEPKSRLNRDIYEEITPKTKTYQNHVQACDYIFRSAIHPENI